MNIVREVEHSADMYDQAAAVSELLLEAALARQADKMAPQTHPDFDGAHCLDCGVPMPATRLIASRIRCTECETIKEQKDRQFAK